MHARNTALRFAAAAVALTGMAALLGCQGPAAGPTDRGAPAAAGDHAAPAAPADGGPAAAAARPPPRSAAGGGGATPAPDAAHPLPERSGGWAAPAVPAPPGDTDETTVPPAMAVRGRGAAEPSKKSKPCVKCHEKENRALVAQWATSTHAHAKEQVGCHECHQAGEQDPDAFKHASEWIAVIVTPKDCGRCHEHESKEHQESHHGAAGAILGSLDNVLGEIVEGLPAAVSGCMQCHGSKVEILEKSRTKVIFDPRTWPNTGMGRINPDGSKGACSACHSRHAFSKAVARRPENCGKCHMGPDHPQIEIYNESKHGVAYRAFADEMNLDADRWVVGEDYHAAPTCATCHMSATPEQPVTHDPGRRLSWNLRPQVSVRQADWETKRDAMKDVCANCHQERFVDAFYQQFDASIDLFDTKFGRPAADLMNLLVKEKLITSDPFDDHIEWTYYYLWHHEGRRARHGASMMGPDYTQWHGFFEVAERFYFGLIPQAEELAARANNAAVKAKIAALLDMPQHRWKKGLSAEDKAKIRKFYSDRYGQ